jgi:hypothetical protein
MQIFAEEVMPVIASEVGRWNCRAGGRDFVA